MRVKTFQAVHPDDALPFKINFGLGGSGSRNFFSILIGENGSRKSLTLRDLAELSFRAAVGQPINDGSIGDEQTRRVTFRGREGDAATPHNVLAISGVATDRFATRISEKGKALRRGNPAYRYVGPKSESNLISRRQSIEQLASSILRFRSDIANKLNRLNVPFEYMTMSRGIVFEFAKPKRRDAVLTLEKMRDVLFEAARRKNESITRLSSRFLEVCFAILRVPGGIELRLNLDDEESLSFSPGIVDPEALLLLVEAGLLDATNSYVLTAAEEKFSLSDFSSGQWHMFSSLFLTALAAEDNSLILVDEPENSLHPLWQLDFLPQLERVLAGVRGVHTIVATHSPLVASSLPASVAEVIKVKRNASGRVSSSKVPAQPFGWTADDILVSVFGLETSRSKVFQEAMDRALRLFAEGDRQNEELRTLVLQLKQYASSLPDSDVAVTVIATLDTVINGKARRQKGSSK